MSRTYNLIHISEKIGRAFLDLDVTLGTPPLRTLTEIKVPTTVVEWNNSKILCTIYLKHYQKYQDLWICVFWSFHLSQKVLRLAA